MPLRRLVVLVALCAVVLATLRRLDTVGLFLNFILGSLVGSLWGRSRGGRGLAGGIGGGSAMALMFEAVDLLYYHLDNGRGLDIAPILNVMAGIVFGSSIGLVVGLIGWLVGWPSRGMSAQSTRGP